MAAYLESGIGKATTGIGSEKGRSAAREALSPLKQFGGNSDLITIRVRTILHLKRIIGSGEVALSLPEGSTLEELLGMMVKRWGKRLSSCLFESNSTIPLPSIRLMVNGRDIAFLHRLKTELQEGDEVLILPPVAGG